MSRELTQELVRERYYYDDGKLFWRKSRKIVGPNSFNSDGYLTIKINKKTYRQHQIIFLYHHGYIPKEIDHINRIKNDNHIENIREASHHGNMRNIDLYRCNTSGFKGVTWFPKLQKWLSRIRVDNHLYHLGVFNSAKEAALAYNHAAEKHFGAFAVFNRVF